MELNKEIIKQLQNELNQAKEQLEREQAARRECHLEHQECQRDLMEAKERERQFTAKRIHFNAKIAELEFANARLTRRIAIMDEEIVRLLAALRQIKGPPYGIQPTLTETMQIAEAALTVPPAKEKL